MAPAMLPSARAASSTSSAASASPAAKPSASTSVVSRARPRRAWIAGSSVALPASTAVRTARSIGVRPAYASVHPRRPQGHRSPPITTTAWPSSPAAPRAPRCRRPPSTTAPPTPVPANTASRLSRPLPAPVRYSARVATLTSFSSRTIGGSSATAPATSRASGTGRSNPERLPASSTSPAAELTVPAEPTPTPSRSSTPMPALAVAARTTAATRSATDAGPPPVGVEATAPASGVPALSTITPWTLVPPRSTPAVRPGMEPILGRAPGRRQRSSLHRWARRPGRRPKGGGPDPPGGRCPGQSLCRSLRWAACDPTQLQRAAHGITRRDMTMASATADETIESTDLAARAVDIVKVFGEGPTAVRALDGIAADFPTGRFTAIMGPSGSGKSTFMHCLAGLDKITSGQVFIGGTELSSLSDKQLTLLRREHVGFIFQAFNLLPTLTAAENIELPMALAGTRADRSWVDRVIDAVGLRDRLSHRPSELSGGQQQRVAAARALASSPSIVFADEPTGNLDSNASAELLGFLRRSV